MVWSGVEPTTSWSQVQRPNYPPVAARLSGNALVLINVVALRRARLVLGWVTVRGYLTKATLPRPTQPGHPSVGRRNEYTGGGLGHR